MKQFVLLAAIVMVTGALLGCSHITGKTAGQSVDDTVITGEIKGKILKDSELKTFAIDVDSYQGNVTLSGQVPNRAAEQRLIQYAQSTKGVKEVRTNLQVASASPGGAAPSRGTSTSRAEPTR